MYFALCSAHLGQRPMQSCLHRTHTRSLPLPPSRHRAAMAAATNHAASASAAPQMHEPAANAHATSATSAPAAPAAFKDVQFVSYDKNGFTVRGRMQLPGVPHNTVMEVLTDYPACASVFHNITSCSAEPLPSGNKRVSQVRWQRSNSCAGPCAGTCARPALQCSALPAPPRGGNTLGGNTSTATPAAAASNTAANAAA